MICTSEGSQPSALKTSFACSATASCWTLSNASNARLCSVKTAFWQLDSPQKIDIIDKTSKIYISPALRNVGQQNFLGSSTDKSNRFSMALSSSARMTTVRRMFFTETTVTIVLKNANRVLMIRLSSQGLLKLKRPRKKSNKAQIIDVSKKKLTRLRSSNTGSSINFSSKKARSLNKRRF